MTTDPVSSVTTARRRRLVISGVLRGLVVTSALTAVYYILPLEKLADAKLWLVLTGGVIILAAVAVNQVRAILRAPYPAVRAIEALSVTVPLFLLLFAAIYFTMSLTDKGNFSVPGLTRTDTLYFTVTTFATVGFGDIVATSETARILVTIQMLLDLIVLGALVRVFVAAVQMARGSTPRTDHR